jgi:hypothetical protein
VLVVPKARDNTIVISSTLHPQRLIISLPSPADAAFWIRAISDFASNTQFSTVANRAKEQEKAAADAAAARRASKKSIPDNVPRVEQVYATGSGNTVDELSSMYGI